jgi:hypothetical protein
MQVREPVEAAIGDEPLLDSLIFSIDAMRPGVAKSKFDRGSPPQNATLTIAAAGQGADHVSLQRIDGRTVERTDKKFRKAVATIRRVVSPDGKNPDDHDESHQCPGTAGQQRGRLRKAVASS